MVGRGGVRSANGGECKLETLGQKAGGGEGGRGGGGGGGGGRRRRREGGGGGGGGGEGDRGWRGRTEGYIRGGD